MANRRFIDFPIATTIGDNDIILIWQDGLNKQATKATLIQDVAQSLNNLTDVELTGLIDGQILEYDSVSGKWINVDKTDFSLGELNNVSIVSPEDGQVLRYNSSTQKWENSSAGYVPYLGAIDDVDLGNHKLTLDSIQFNDIATNNVDPLQLKWNQEAGTLDLGMGYPDVVQQIGMETFYPPVKNQTGVLIPNGTVVRAVGTLGASGRILIAPSIGDGSIPSRFILGITTHDINDGEDGIVTWFGLVRQFDTIAKSPIGETWVDGDVLWVNPLIDGGLTKVEPSAPNIKVSIAIVVNAGNNGTLMVRPSIGLRLTDLHDVDAFNPNDKDLISFDSTLGHWDAKSLGDVINGLSSQFLKGDGSLDSNVYALNSSLANYQLLSQKGQANGYASLDSGGKVPLTQIPDSVLGQVEYQGTWNASTNSPTLLTPPASSTKGHYYVVSVAGTQFGISFEIGDWIISNGASWQKVDNTDSVTSVFGRIGAILALETDYQSYYPRLSQSYLNPSWISSLAWSKITGSPTTLSGYGITDAVPSIRTITINGVTLNLSANRSWNVGTVTSVNMSVPTGFSISGNPITTSGILALAFATGYSLPSDVKQADWDSAFNDTIVSISFNSLTGDLLFTQEDGGTISLSLDGRYALLSSLSGYVPTSRTITINGVVYDLSANRSWSVGTVTSVGMSVPTGFEITNSPITGAGTLALAFANGYSLPSNLDQADWDSAFNNTIVSASFNTATGLLSFTQEDGGTISVSLEGRYALASSLSSYVPTSRTITINGVTFNLSANRTWNVGTVTSVGMSVPTGFQITGSPITGAGTLALTFATGYSLPSDLDQADWDSAFNDKIVSASFNTSTGLLTLTQQDGGTVTVSLENRYALLSSLAGYVPNTRTITINGVVYDLSANRTWNVGTVTSVGMSVPTGFQITGSPITGSGSLGLQFASGYSLPSDLDQTNWDSAFNDKIVSASFNTSTGLLTLTQEDGGTVTVSLEDRYALSSSLSGYVTLSTNQTISGQKTFTDNQVFTKSLINQIYDMGILTISANYAIIPSGYSGIRKVVLANNVTFSPTVGTAGTVVRLYVTQDATGGRTLSWDNSLVQITWANNYIPPTLSTSAGRTDLIVLTWTSSTTAYGEFYKGSDQYVTLDSQQSIDSVKIFNQALINSIHDAGTKTSGFYAIQSSPLSSVRKVTLGGNFSMSTQSGTAGAVVRIFLIQDATGGRTLSWVNGGASIIWANGGSAPTLSTSPNSVDLVVLTWISDSVIYGEFKRGATEIVPAHTHSASDIVSGILSVARGGTGIGSYTTGNFIYASGATTLAQRTPAQVLSAISGVPTSRQITINGVTFDLSANRTWDIDTGFDAVYDNGSSGAGTKNFDWANGLTQKILLTGNSTWTFANPSSGKRYEILISQDSTGSRSIVFPEIYWENKTVPIPTSSPNSKDKVELTYDGSIYWGKYYSNFGVPSDLIIQTNLLFWLDPANTDSYIGSGTNWNDLTANNFDATLVNGVGFTSADANGAMIFDGSNDYATQSSAVADSFVGQQSFTVGFWIKPDTSPPSQQTVWGILQNETTQSRMQVRIYSSGIIRLGYFAQDLDSASGVITFGSWQYVVVQYDSVTDTSKIYVNGSQVASGSQGGLLAGTGRVVEFGRYNGVEYYKGRIGAVHSYTAYQSSGDINTNFEALRGRYGV